MNVEKLDQERKKALQAAELRAGVREGHYLLDGKFVDVWVSFYPKVQWWIADATRPRGDRIRLKSWL